MMKSLVCVFLFLFSLGTVNGSLLLNDTFQAFKYVRTSLGCYISRYEIQHDTIRHESATNNIPRDSYPAECYEGSSTVEMNMVQRSSGKYYLYVCAFFPEDYQRIRCDYLKEDGYMYREVDVYCNDVSLNNWYPDRRQFLIKDFVKADSGLIYYTPDRSCEVYRNSNGKYETRIYNRGYNLTHSYDPVDKHVTVNNVTGVYVFEFGRIAIDHYPDGKADIAYDYDRKGDDYEEVKTCFFRIPYEYIMELTSETVDSVVIPSLKREFNRAALTESFVKLSYIHERPNDADKNCRLVIEGLLGKTVGINTPHICPVDKPTAHSLAFDWDQYDQEWYLWLCLFDGEYISKISLECWKYDFKLGSIDGEWKFIFHEQVSNCKDGIYEYDKKFNNATIYIGSIGVPTAEYKGLTLILDMKQCTYEFTGYDNGEEKVLSLAEKRSLFGRTCEPLSLCYTGGYDRVRDVLLDSTPSLYNQPLSYNHLTVDSYGKNTFIHKADKEMAVKYQANGEIIDLGKADLILEYPAAVRAILRDVY